MRYKDLTGNTYHYLTVLRYAGSTDAGDATWECLCKCGNTTIVRGKTLIKGGAKSCGCWHREESRMRIAAQNRTHGLSRTRIYQEWSRMKTRCGNPNTKKYDRYGGRGIAVCDEWANDFMAFRAWALVNGYSDTLTLERKDIDGNYCPENCTWIPFVEQAKNRRDTIRFVIDGIEMCRKDAARKLGVSYSSLRHHPELAKGRN